MIYRVNLVAYKLSHICNEITSIVNNLEPTCDIGFAIKQCINMNKSLVGLDGYIVMEDQKTISYVLSKTKKNLFYFQLMRKGMRCL